MKKIIVCAVSAVAVVAMVSSCGKKHQDGLIYESDQYSVYSDSVVQGKFVAKAVSPLEITTNYESPDLAGASSKVDFRFSMNSRDNELAPGKSHAALIGDKASDERVYSFGSVAADEPLSATGKELPKDHQWTVRLDMRPVLKSFGEKGYFVTQTGDTIYSDDFKGVWIAGSVEPLTWDFENLYGKDDRKLKDRGDSIFEVTLTVNPTVDKPANPTGWKVEKANPNYPQFETPQTLVAAMYNLSIDEIVSNIRPDDAFKAGKAWDGVWTRDVAYSVYLSLAYLDPQRSMNSLRAKVKDGHIIQDTGTGGAWPVSSDRVVWGIAAWEIYLTTGDVEWLKEANQILLNTLEADFEVVYNSRYGLMRGEQSYLDWREQTYPKWMQPADIYESMCLGTNVVFARTCQIATEMSAELKKAGVEVNSPVADKAAKMAETLKQSINNRLWMPTKGYYSEYLYGGVYPIQSQATDNLGQALSVLFDVASPDMAKSLVEKTPLVPFGTSSVFPQLPNIKPYHNDAIWPFVQAYWNLAAAKAGNMTALTAGIASIYRQAAMFATNKELFVASNGDYRGTAVNSDSQLWSCTGNAAMVFRVYAGMTFATDGIHFAPMIPAGVDGDKKISGFKYRGATLDITIKGIGTEIQSFAIDGKAQSNPVFAANLTGKHTIDIVMANNEPAESKINVVEQKWMPITPIVTWAQTSAKIDNYDKNQKYTIYNNGVETVQVSAENVSIAAPNNYTLVGLTAVDKDGLTSFMPRPHEYIPAGALTIVQAEDFAAAGTKFIADPAKAKRFVELTKEPLTFKVSVAAEGDYFVDVRYANGAGPINTENKCAIRSLEVNGAVAGPVVMPQRGIGEWLSTGFSNMIPVRLKAGENNVSIVFKPYNENMNGEFNTALVDYIRVIYEKN